MINKGQNVDIKPNTTNNVDTTKNTTRDIKNNGRHNKNSRGKDFGLNKNSKGPKLSSKNFLSHLNPDKKNVDFTVKKGEEPVKIGSLLGLEQVGQCIFIEYKDDIILIDAGMEFASASDALGVDYLIPDTTYIKRNIKKLKGIFLTHGHLDHVGALKDILPDLGWPMIYTTPLTLGIVKRTFDNLQDAQKVKYKIIDPDIDIIRIGAFSIEFARVNHNIPETLAIAIHTPKGTIFTSADFKIDHTPAIDRPADLSRIARIGTEGVKLYIGDSLGTNRVGHSISEKIIGRNIDEIIKSVKGRLVIATFSSNIGRVIQIIQSSIRHNKKIFLSGRSMENNVQLCQELGYIELPKGTVKPLDKFLGEAEGKDSIVICTGAQGEEYSALARMARGEHVLKIKKGDSILISGSTIPGNESNMKSMIDYLVTNDINLITNREIDIHTGGHGLIEDHKTMLSLLRPEFFLPFYMPAEERYSHKAIAIDMGIPEDRILMPSKNGKIIEMYDNFVCVSKNELQLSTVVIDGKGIGHLSGEYVIRARKIMANDGMVALIFKIDYNSKELVGNIQIESRGFVYSSEVKSIHTSILNFAKKKYNETLKKVREEQDNRMSHVNIKILLKSIKTELEHFMEKLIGRLPMIVPMFVYVCSSPTNEEDLHVTDENLIGMTLEEQGKD